MTENAKNIQPVSYRKCLPTFEGSPDDSLNYIDLHYTPAAFKLPHSSSQSKFNSLPNIKSGRKSRYLSSLEGILYPKSDTMDNLSKDVDTKDIDTVSKTSESTTVVISTSDSVCSDSPRGVANEAFEDDEVDLPCKKEHRRSPSGSIGKNFDVSYSSSGSSIEIPPIVSKDDLMKKEMSKEYQKYIVPESHRKRGWRGEKLYFSKPGQDSDRDGHVRRFCWWMVCLVLLAGAITVAALIGVGIIKLPLHTQQTGMPNFDSRKETGPRVGQVMDKDAPQEPTIKNLIEMLSPPKMNDDKASEPFQQTMTTWDTRNEPSETNTETNVKTTKAANKAERIPTPVTTSSQVPITPEHITTTTYPDTRKTTNPEEYNTRQILFQTDKISEPSVQNEKEYNTENISLHTSSETKDIVTQSGTGEPEQKQETTTPMQTIVPLSFTATEKVSMNLEDKNKETKETVELLEEIDTIPNFLTVETSTEEPRQKEGMDTTISEEEGSTQEISIIFEEEKGSDSVDNDIWNEDSGSGQGDISETESNSPVDTFNTISVEELLKEDFIPSELPIDTNDLEVNQDYTIIRDTPKKEVDSNDEMELVITLPDILTGSLLNKLNNDLEKNLGDGSGDASFDQNHQAESETFKVSRNTEESTSFDNGEDVFKALLDLILPKSTRKQETNESNENDDLSIQELIKHIGSQ